MATEVNVTKPAACQCGGEVDEAELIERLDECIKEYRGKPGALIPVLQTAQAIFGYLPRKALKQIALGLDRSYSEIAGIVGFYSFFSTVPRGRHIVRVCLGTACYVRGGKRVLEAIKQKLDIDIGGTTADGEFSLDVARCFGACGLAPAIMIDDVVYQRVKPTKLGKMLEQVRNNGSPADKERDRSHDGKN